MNPIVAKISKEIQKIFQDLTDDESVCIADVEEQVSAAATSWVQRLSEEILSEIANAPAMASKSVVCQECQGRSHRYRRRSRSFTTLCGVLRGFSEMGV